MSGEQRHFAYGGEYWYYLRSAKLNWKSILLHVALFFYFKLLPLFLISPTKLELFKSNSFSLKCDNCQSHQFVPICFKSSSPFATDGPCRSGSCGWTSRKSFKLMRSIFHPHDAHHIAAHIFSSVRAKAKMIFPLIEFGPGPGVQHLPTVWQGDAPLPSFFPPLFLRGDQSVHPR